MEYTLEVESQKGHIHMQGRFTFEDNMQFRDLISKLQTQPLSQVTLELDEVDYIDSAGMGMLLLLRDYALKQKVKLVLARPGGQLRKMLTLAKFDQMFVIEG